MFAIIQSGGRQHRVEPGGVVMVDRLDGVATGDQLTIDTVLLVSRDSGEVVAGAPFVANARVTGVVDGEARGPKIRIFMKKRRKGSRRTHGHRATYTRVKITGIDT